MSACQGDPLLPSSLLSWETVLSISSTHLSQSPTPPKSTLQRGCSRQSSLDSVPITLCTLTSSRPPASGRCPILPCHRPDPPVFSEPLLLPLQCLYHLCPSRCVCACMCVQVNVCVCVSTCPALCWTEASVGLKRDAFSWSSVLSRCCALTWNIYSYSCSQWLGQCLAHGRTQTMLTNVSLAPHHLAPSASSSYTSLMCVKTNGGT